MALSNSGDEKGIETKDTEINLFEATMKKDAPAFKKALQRALKNVQATDNIHNTSSINGNSMIHVAAKFGNGEIVKSIADHEELRFMLTKTNSNGDTVLHVAARAGNESVFNVLKHLPNDIESGTGSSVLDGLLLVRNSEGNTALHEALIHRRKRMAKDLMVLMDQDVFFTVNHDGKSALYLSVEAGYFCCVKYMLEDDQNIPTTYDKLKEGKSVIHAAVQGNHTKISSLLIECLPDLIYVKDENGRSMLHVAASMGALQMTRNLLKSRHGFGLDERDMKGMMPIHHAAKNNCVNVMKELLRHYHDPCELLTRDGKNILHVAVKFGRYNAVRCIMDSPELNMLLNQMDGDGNTPLHLASEGCHPHIVSALTWDDRVKVDAQNKNKQYPLDVIGTSKSTIGGDIVFKQMLTWAALKAAKTPECLLGGDVVTVQTYKDTVNSLLLVSTLVVTVTFAAGFTMPGAYNSSEAPTDPGTAINLKHLTFQVYVICNAIAMYSAMLVAVLLMWAQLGSFRILRSSLRLALPLIGSALSMMCIAFMTGIYVTVSRLRWIALSMLIFGCGFLVPIIGLFFIISFPIESNNRCIRFLTHYFIFSILRTIGIFNESHTDM